MRNVAIIAIKISESQLRINLPSENGSVGLDLQKVGGSGGETNSPVPDGKLFLFLLQRAMIYFNSYHRYCAN